jgi:hypothetical protein
MERQPFIFPGLAAVSAGVLAVAGGCQKQQPLAEEPVAEALAAPPQREMAWEERPLGGVASFAARPMPVTEGPAPLVYLTEQGVTVRVVDRGNERTLAEAAVPGRTIVRVDNRTGVVAGRQTLVPGPLPAGRRYAILIVPQGESVSRTGTMRERVEQPVEDEVIDRVVDPTGSGGETQRGPRQ